jgi:hypothetical protein
LQKGGRMKKRTVVIFQLISIFVISSCSTLGTIINNIPKKVEVVAESGDLIFQYHILHVNSGNAQNEKSVEQIIDERQQKEINGNAYDYVTEIIEENESKTFTLLAGDRLELAFTNRSETDQIVTINVDEKIFKRISIKGKTIYPKYFRIDH